MADAEKRAGIKQYLGHAVVTRRHSVADLYLITLEEQAAGSGTPHHADLAFDRVNAAGLCRDDVLADSWRLFSLRCR